MELYDSTIREIRGCIENGRTPSYWGYEPERAWADTGQNELVLTRDAAYELGGSNLPASNCTCVTTDAALVPEDRIVLVGPDLGEIRADTAFARIVLLHVNSISGDDQEAFRTIRDMEFVKYHVFPAGYMMRISPENGREQVRVSRQAVKRGISFRNIGNSFIKKYKENKLVDHVSIIFVTGDKPLCKALADTAKKVDAITLTLNHIMDGLATDCSVCSFKTVCDEVEGMKELHFKKGAEPMKI